MLTLPLFLVLLKVFLLALACSGGEEGVGAGLHLTLLICSAGRKVQVHVRISLSAVPTHWLLLMLALLLIGGSTLTFLYSLASVFVNLDVRTMVSPIL